VQVDLRTAAAIFGFQRRRRRSSSSMGTTYFQLWKYPQISSALALRNGGLRILSWIAVSKVIPQRSDTVAHGHSSDRLPIRRTSATSNQRSIQPYGWRFNITGRPPARRFIATLIGHLHNLTDACCFFTGNSSQSYILCSAGVGHSSVRHLPERTFSRMNYGTSAYFTQILHHVPKNTKQICFCQNCVKFPPILIIFRRKMANDPNICEVHSFSTSPNLRHRLTALNANVPNCYITPNVILKT